MEASAADTATKVAFEKKDDHVVLTAKISADKIKLFVDCKKLNPEDTHIITADSLKALLPGVSPAQLHEEVLGAIAAELCEGKEVVNRRVAKGKLSVDGRDGKLVLLVKKYQRPGGSNSPEFVDPRYMKNFDNVEQGTAIGRLYPPTEGADGIDVYGAPIKAKTGKPAKYAVHESVSVVPPAGGNRYETLTATVAGFVTEENGKLIVKDQLVVSGDVSFKTGDLDFIGSVLVKGTVMKNFSVRARKNVIVEGGVNCGYIDSFEEGIIIKGTAVGETLRQLSAGDSAEAHTLKRSPRRERPDFKCTGNFQAHALQGVSVETVGDIIVEKEASNCLLRSRGVVQLPSGHLFGGDTYVVCGVEARVFGTKSGAETVIHLSSDIESSVEYANLVEQIRSTEAAVELLRLHLGPYADNPARLQLLKDPHRTKMKAMLDKLRSVSDSRKSLETKRLELVATAHTNPVLRVNFHETFFTGVIIKAGETEFTPERTLPGPGTIEYLTAPKTFVITELKPITCTVERRTTGMRE